MSASAYGERVTYKEDHIKHLQEQFKNVGKSNIGHKRNSGSANPMSTKK